MISFIYFDVGGVVIDDFSGNDKWQQLKAELGITAKNDAAFEKLWDEHSPGLNTTRDAEVLLAIFKKELGLQLPPDYSLLDGFVKRFEANPCIWPIIESVKQKVGVGLLTNMYPGMFAAIERRGIMPRVNWDAVVDSSIELLQKPDWKLFELAEQKAQVKGQEILFVDNGAGHVKEAKAFGWQTFLYDSANHEAACHELAAFLQTRGLLDIKVESLVEAQHPNP